MFALTRTHIRMALAGAIPLLFAACVTTLPQPPEPVRVPIPMVTPPPPPPPPTPGAVHGPPVTFVLVPHAEVANDDPDDPTLSAAGRARAQQLRNQLGNSALIAVYTDEFRRTQQTAQPTLDANREIHPQRYFSRGPLRDTSRQWRKRYILGTVLVVGEPEAIAPLANGLCDCKVRPLRADETDRLIRIERTADGKIHVDDGRYGKRP